jgi:hypothetical protein
VVEEQGSLGEVDAATGSFDSVRLAPHFAQDDKGFGFANDQRLTTNDGSYE